MSYITKFLLAFFLLHWPVYLNGNEGRKWIEEDLKPLERSAQEGDSYAQGFLALCYVHGDKGLDISFDKASYWANLSMETNHWLGLFTMGYLNRFPPIGPNPQRVGSLYTKVFSDPDGTLVKNVAANDPVASYVLAEIFTAEEVEPELSPDLRFAAKHYASSSSSGYAPATVQHALLKLHANAIEGQNIDIGKDLAGGVSLLKEVAGKKLPSGHHFLGRCYFKGIGVNEDYEMALVHFQAAADRGYTTAQLIVAHFYAYGLTGPAKIDLALRYANLALLQDRVKASEKIAEYEQLLADQASGKERPIMRQPLNTVPSPTASSIMEPPPLPPEPTAVNIQPRDPVFKPTVNRLPSIYENIGSTEPPPPPDIPSSPQTGLSPEEIPPPAPNRLLPSGTSNSNADLEMAKKHYFGLGAPIDIDRAYSLFSRSANRGNPESARYLGIMYLRGKGVQKDTNKALEWFTRAAQGGDELAKKNLKTLQILGN